MVVWVGAESGPHHTQYVEEIPTSISNGAGREERRQRHPPPEFDTGLPAASRTEHRDTHDQGKCTESNRWVRSRRVAPNRCSLGGLAPAIGNVGVHVMEESEGEERDQKQEGNHPSPLPGALHRGGAHVKTDRGSSTIDYDHSNHDEWEVAFVQPTYSARCRPVRVELDATRSAGVPSNTIRPPSCPAPGPRSIIQSAWAITAR